MIKIRITPRKIFIALLAIIFFLTAAHIIGRAFYFSGHQQVFGLVHLFNLDAELNFPTYYSTAALLLCSLLISGITVYHHKNKSPYIIWSILAFVFLFLSFDELTSYHEQLTGTVKSIIDTPGVFYFAWVIPYAAFVFLFFILYLKFLADLPRDTAILFIVSGMVYILGAIGMELIGGYLWSTAGQETIIYTFVSTIEEFLEMIGIAIFIFALLTYIQKHVAVISIHIDKN